MFVFWLQLVEIVFLCNMRDFNFVSIKIHSFFGVKFLKNSQNFFINSVLKVFLTIFLQNLSIFRIYEFCFFLFLCSLQEDRSLYWMISYFFYVLNAEQ